MTAYGKNNLYNKHVQDNTSEAFDLGLIQKSTLDNVINAYRFRLYTPNYFIRIGLGLLSAVAILFFTLLVGLITGVSGNIGVVTLCLLLALVCYVLLEYFVGANKYFNAGIDNVLLVSVLLFVIVAFNINDYFWQYQLTSIIVAVLCGWLVIRFNDSLMAALCYAAIIAFWFFTCTQAGDVGKAIAPFITMLVSAVCFFIVSRLIATESLFLYGRCFKVMKLLALITFYISGNYYIVRELGSLMFATALESTQSIPFGWFFWLCTAIIPPAYFVYGILKKDIMFLRTGFVLAVISVLTFRYYYSVLPASEAMIIFGLLFIVGAYLLIKYLHTIRKGFTSGSLYKIAKPVSDIEAIIIAQAFGSKTVHQHEGVEFGGGSSGGGGATGEF